MGRGIRAGLKVFLAGYAPFVPWFDYHFLFYEEGEKSLTLQDFYDYSIAWLEVSDAVLVLPKSDKSNGVKKELERAVELKIPIFYSLEDLIKRLDRGLDK